jgi:hypothetical protein
MDDGQFGYITKLTKKSAGPPKARICVAVSSFPDLFLRDDDDLELVVGYLCSFALFFLAFFLVLPLVFTACR